MCFDAFLQLSPDKKRFIFTKKIFKKRYQKLNRLDPNDSFKNKMNGVNARMNKIDEAEDKNSSKVRSFIAAVDEGEDSFDEYQTMYCEGD